MRHTHLDCSRSGWSWSHGYRDSGARKYSSRGAARHIVMGVNFFSDFASKLANVNPYLQKESKAKSEEESYQRFS